MQPHTYVVALVGNPNAGKSTIFNALTGFRQRVANYPGVTVEAVKGALRGANGLIELIDLPGTYSLSASSPDEMIVADLALGHIAGQPRPDAIVAVVDATNLRRHLYLVSQVLELGRPVVVALNMMDIARRRGVEIDLAQLEERLGVPVVPVTATQPETLAALARRVERSLGAAPPPDKALLPDALRAAADELTPLAPAEALRVLVDREGYAEQRYRARHDGSRLDAARAALDRAGMDGAVAEVEARYAWIGKTLSGITRRGAGNVSWSQRLDRVLTDRFAGLAILTGVFFLTFQAIFTWAEPLMMLVEDGFALLAEHVGAWLPDGVVRSLIGDGLIAGVGGVLVFLPQIVILFGLIALLEDCGYLSRAAFMMDRLMRGVGLSGRSFIPLLSSFACAIPAIMGARTIADRRERFTTILLAPFMSCSARLPVYTLMIGAFVPATKIADGWISLQGLVLFAMYLVGIIAAIPLGWLLRATAFRGPPSGFLMELPSYKRPRIRAVLQRMWMAGQGFVVRAGSVILVANMLVWALGYFPRDARIEDSVRAAAAADWDEDRLAAEIDRANLEHSYLGRVGHAVEPVFRPLGWDWRISVAVLASFPAREVVIATMGTIFALGDVSADEGEGRLRDALRRATWPDDGPMSGRPLMTLPAALSLMVFFALCAQCASTLAIIWKETGSWIWPAVSFGGMTLLAYLAAWATYVVARNLPL